MKRLVAAILVAFITMALAFSNVEMDLNLCGAPLCLYNLDTDFDTKISLENPIGFDTRWGFMIGAPAPFCDIGIKFDYAFDFFWNLHTESEAQGETFTNDQDAIGLGLNFTLGPLVRFNLGKWHTIYFSPGLMLKSHFAWCSSDDSDSNSDSDYNYHDSYYDNYYDYDDYEYQSGSSGDVADVYSSVGLAFDLDIGYRVWIINRVGFHFGFDVGVDMNWPLVMKIFTNGDSDYDVLTKESGEYKIYFGFCFNFGDKSPDKYK